MFEQCFYYSCASNLAQRRKSGQCSGFERAVDETTEDPPLGAISVDAKAASKHSAAFAFTRAVLAW